jgi:hypothetical protein
MENPVKAIMTFEMLGKPKEYLEESMTKFIEVFSAEKNMIISSKKVYPPKQVENKDKDGVLIAKDDIYSTFAELSLELNDLISLFLLTFKYLPSHVEIEKPQELRLKNNELNIIISEIIMRLHNYDSIAKGALLNNQALASKLKELMQNQNIKLVENTQQKSQKSDKPKKQKKNKK